MPIYEYCCDNCHNKFEVMRSMSESNKETDCPNCNQKARRSLSRFASFTKDSSGTSIPVAGTGSSCSGCSSSSCASCGM